MVGLPKMAILPGVMQLSMSHSFDKMEVSWIDQERYFQ